MHTADAHQDEIDGETETGERLIGVDAVKTVRLALFPLQFTAACQDRLARYIDQALLQVPPGRRIAPRESLILPIADRLRFQEDDNPISQLYVNLLAWGMDRERVGEAHPAFFNIVSQLAPDEAQLLEQLSQSEYCVYFRLNNRYEPVLRDAYQQFIASLPIEEATKLTLSSRALVPDALLQPAFFLTYLEHLVSLGVVEYDNEPKNAGEQKMIRLAYDEADFFCVRLSSFGRLFHGACIQ